MQAPVYGVAHPIGGSPQVHELAITQSVVDAVLERLPERQLLAGLAGTGLVSTASAPASTPGTGD